VWPADEVQIDVDLETIQSRSTLPVCVHCGGLARPNILMFGDYDWISTESDSQAQRLLQWLASARRGTIVAVECGAGLAIPTVRDACEQMAHHLIRINPRDFQTPSQHGIGIPLGAADALQRIDALL
jgi:hypothetical protein